MRVFSETFTDESPIPATCAFCDIDPGAHARLAGNRNPHLRWGDLPEATRSVAIVCIDGDVPTVGDDVNREGRVVPADLPRTEFLHWALVDVAPDVNELAEGACSDGVTAGGKSAPPGPPGSRQGVNDYTGWFARDPEMGGTYRGYDGPGPPWNDELVHRYRFEVWALDVERLELPSDFGLAELRAAAAGHVLERAAWTGTYTMNPGLRA